jgi:hypothetical protein
MTLAVIVWLLAGLVVALTTRLASEYLWIAADGPVIIWAIIGLFLMVQAAFRLRRSAQRRAAGAVLVAIAAGVVLFLPAAKLGTALTGRARFALQRPGYDRVIASLRTSTPREGFQKSHGLRHVVDPGPPVRVAFPWPGGIIDNWCGAIFDPTGHVMQANRFKGDWSMA